MRTRGAGGRGRNTRDQLRLLRSRHLPVEKSPAARFRAQAAPPLLEQGAHLYVIGPGRQPNHPAARAQVTEVAPQVDLLVREIEHATGVGAPEYAALRQAAV